MSGLKTVIDAIFRPSRFLESHSATRQRRASNRLSILVRSLLFLVFNLAVYALPLAVSYSTLTGSTPNEVFIQVIYPFLLLTGITLCGFHAGVSVTGVSRGLIESIRTVTTTVGVYLALAMGFAFPLLVAQDALGAFLRGATMYMFVFTGGRATAPTPPQLVIIVAGVAFCYYAYSLYAATRIRHTASSMDAIVVTGLSLVAPIVIFPYLLSPTDSAIPQVFFSTSALILSGIIGVVIVLAIAIDFIR